MRAVSRRGFLLGGTAVVVGAGSGSAWALDRFVVDHVDVSDTDAYEAASGSTGTTLDTTEATTSAAPAGGETWSADGTTITVTKHQSGSGSSALTWFVADLVLTDATVLRTGFAAGEFGQNIVENTSVIAAANDAVFAVNGDYYGFRETGIEVRNGVAYRDNGAREGLAFHRDGSIVLYDETRTSAQALVDAGVWTTLSFGPALVAGGVVQDGIDDVEVDTNFGNHSIQGAQPRTAVGVLGPDHVVVVVVDGRDPGYSRGVTMTELAEIFVDLGATTAYNLDGGGSSTLYFQGEVVNRPSNGGERGVSDILYVAG